MDYREFYNLENYLYERVNCAFQERGWLTAEEFFCIIIWKSNRAKSKVSARLLNKGYKNLDDAVKVLTSGIGKLNTSEEKFIYMVSEWGFRLPITSAILTVLFPEDFTVYDYRVCESLGKYNELNRISSARKLWKGYSEYLNDVRRRVPRIASLRDKDRYIWGKSFYLQLKNDIDNCFGAKYGT